MATVFRCSSRYALNSRISSAVNKCFVDMTMSSSGRLLSRYAVSNNVRAFFHVRVLNTFDGFVVSRAVWILSKNNSFGVILNLQYVFII